MTLGGAPQRTTTPGDGAGGAGAVAPTSGPAFPAGAAASPRPAPPRGIRLALLSDAARGRNGVGVYYDDLLAQLRGRVEAVTLVAPPGTPEEPFPGLSFPMPGDPTQSLFLPSIPALWRRVRDFRPNVIVAATPFTVGLLGIPLARETGAALCMGYHTQFDKLAELYWSGPVTRFARPVFRWWDRFLFQFADRVLVHNEELVEAAASEGVREVDVMGTPVAGEFVSVPPPPAPRQIRSVLFVGRLAPEKEALQVARAAEAHPGITFRVAGDGPEAPQMAEAAARLPNLEHLGWVPRERIRELLDGCDAMVLPSRFETFGTAAYEGMLRRRLVVVTSGCGLVAWPGLAAGVVVLEEGEEVSGALTRLASLPGEFLARRAETALQGALAHNEETMDHWMEVLEDAVRRRRA